jgi:hypothetical protein
MSAFVGTEISNSGLVFAYDMGNKKSYAGPPIQNLLTQITVNTGSAAGFSITQTEELINVPELEITAIKNALVQNNYPAVSTNCCPNVYNYGASIPVSPSTLYTYAILYKTESEYTHPNFMYRYEYTSGAVYITEGGVHSTGSRINLGA